MEFVFQLLAQLLKSKNADDLQAANRLIKSMVKAVSALVLLAGRSADTRYRLLGRSKDGEDDEAFDGFANGDQ